MNAVDAVVLAAYASLVVELVLFPIPSEASTWQLLAPAAAPGPDAGAPLARAARQPLGTKLLRYLLPTALGVGLFLVPPVCIAVPDARRALTTEVPPAVAAAGVAAIVLGRAVTFTSVLQLRAARATRGALAHGLFRWSRNPGLCGMFLFYAGLCLVTGAPLLALGAPLYVLNMHGRVRLEEAHLAASLGERWSAYRTRVARYLPVPGLR